MTIIVAFVTTIAVVIGAGLSLRRWDESRNLRFTDEAGSHAGLWALAWVEGRQMALHPTWLITVGFFGAITVFFSDLDDQTISAGKFESFTYIAIPLGGLALVVVGHRLGTRSRRNNLEELEAATPTAPRTRTASLVVACLAPLPIAGLLAVILTVAVQLVVPRPAPVTASALLSQSGFLWVIVGGGVVGVLLSRWLPVAAAPLLGIVAIIFLNNGPDHLHPRYRWLRPAVELNIGGAFDIRPERWQPAFILGLVALGACLAMLRHPPRPAIVMATVVALAIVGSVGWIMTRPPSAAQVAGVVDRLEHPEAHQTCVTRTGVRFCTYPGAEDWVDDWASAIHGVVTQVPTDRRPTGLEVIQREPVWPWTYLDEVSAAIDPQVAWADDGRIHPSLILDTSAPDLTVAWQTAAVAVGLPASVNWQRPSGCMAGGQARQVLSLLLAARATPTTRSALQDKATWIREEAKQHSPVSADTAWDYSTDTPTALGVKVSEADLVAADGVTRRDFIAVAGASGWGTDVLAAAALLDTDRSGLDTLIAARWDELVDATTTTDQFLEWAGVKPIPGIGPSTLDDPHSCP